MKDSILCVVRIEHRLRRAAVIAFLTILLAFNAAAAHRYHTSLTRLDYNDAEQSVEAALQLFTHDLIKVLEARTGKKVDLEKTPDVNRQILAYLQENFILRDAGGAPAPLRWVGKELSVDVIWIYFEIPFSESLERKTLQNSIFLETFPEQTNIVICRYEKKRADLLFKAGDKIKEIQGLGGRENSN